MTTAVFRDIDEILDGIKRTGIVHVGAHRGQEVGDFRAAKFRRIVLVEANPNLVDGLRALGVDEVWWAACSTRPSEVLQVTEWDERSSVLTPTAYPVVDRVEVKGVPLADMQHGCNVAVVDVQGAELDVLQSADLDLLDAIIVEVSDLVRYHGAATRTEIAEFLTRAGWRHQGDYPGGHSAGIADSVWRHPTCV